MKNLIQKYKKDILLITSILIVAAVIYLLLQWQNGPGEKVIVQCEDEVIATYDLSENIETTIETPYGQNTLQIRDGVASVTAADCPDKLCVNQGGISETGQTIVCLPHKLVISVEEVSP